MTKQRPYAMISVPMTGRKPLEIARDKKKAKLFLEAYGYTVLDVQFDKNKGCSEKQYAFLCLAKVLQVMQKCDAVFFCHDWVCSKGCHVEHFVATMYGLKRIYQDDLIALLDNSEDKEISRMEHRLDELDIDVGNLEKAIDNLSKDNKDMKKLNNEVRPGAKDAPPVKQREVPPTISAEEFIETCKTILFNKESERLDKFERSNFTMDDIFVVWYCKSLQNHKALLSSKLMNGRYIEFTYNGDLKKYYVDSYEKQEHSEFTFTKEERG